MTQEDKELLLKDLCTRLPYGVIIQVKDWTDLDAELKIGHINRLQINDVELKPYLFPMSSMTDGEKEEYCQLQQRVIYNSKGPVNEDVTKYINWCYKKHLDINNLIPIGLAIDATGLNIY